MKSRAPGEIFPGEGGWRFPAGPDFPAALSGVFQGCVQRSCWLFPGGQINQVVGHLRSHACRLAPKRPAAEGGQEILAEGSRGLGQARVPKPFVRSASRTETDLLPPWRGRTPQMTEPP